MSDPENEAKPSKRGPKHMRLRYYTSFEEATIVKVWREHLPEITSYTENLAIFRDIAFALQQHRIRLNKQEVRRRISNYRNKYLVEKNRLEADPQYKSEWRLFQLVDCLFQTPPTTPVVPERKWIEDLEATLRQELPDLTRFNRHDCRTLKFEMDPNQCPFYEGSTVAQVKSKPNALSARQPPLPILKTEIKSELVAQPGMGSLSEKRSPLTPANRTLEAQPTLETTSTVRRSRRRSIMPRTGQITIAHVERLRQENELLVEQRDANLADLALKEREYQQLEQTFDYWLHQQETWIAYLDEYGVK